MMGLTKRKVLAMAIGSAMLAACSGEPSASGDVSRETLRAVGDRFDKAQIEQNRDELERLIADDFVFVGSGGVREDRKSTRLNSSHYCANSMPSSAGKKKTRTKTTK